MEEITNFWNAGSEVPTFTCLIVLFCFEKHLLLKSFTSDTRNIAAKQIERSFKFSANNVNEFFGETEIPSNLLYTVLGVKSIVNKMQRWIFLSFACLCVCVVSDSRYFMSLLIYQSMS